MRGCEGVEATLGLEEEEERKGGMAWPTEPGLKVGGRPAGVVVECWRWSGGEVAVEVMPGAGRGRDGGGEGETSMRSCGRRVEQAPRELVGRECCAQWRPHSGGDMAGSA